MYFYRVFNHFWRFLVKYKLTFILFLISLTALGVLESLQPIFYGMFIEALRALDQNFVTRILIGFILLRFGELTFNVITYWVGDAVLLPASRDARLAVFKKLQELDFAFHINRASGSLISAIKRGDGAFFNMFHILNNIYRIFIKLIVILIVFNSISLYLIAVLIFFVLVNLWAAYFMIRKNITKRRLFNIKEDNVSAIIVDNLINYETVKFFAQEKYEYQRLKKHFRPWIKALWGYANTFRLIDITFGTLGNTLMILITIFGINRVTHNYLTPGQFIMILSYITSFYWRFFDLVYKLRDLAKSYSDIEKYFGILDEPITVKDPLEPVKKKIIKGEIVFDNVSFSYADNNSAALSQFNLHIRQGQSIALVGLSGAGKTTVVKLLLRFFDIQEGKITIDGVDIRNFKKSDLRSFFGIVPQEPILFNNTLRFNIAYGRPNASQTEIIAAAKMAHAWEFIKDMPQGLDTLVGERGVKLSGGQKQRIAIARVILKNPPIIIFDEATSQLDSQSEELIQEAFWQIAKNKTTIVIAHRLSTVMAADKIIVIDNGQVKEAGSHRELIRKKGGLYRKLWQMQTGLLD